MAEWLKALAWKASVRLYRTAGSNPALSAKNTKALLRALSLLEEGMGIRTLFELSTGEAGFSDAQRPSRPLRQKYKGPVKGPFVAPLPSNPAKYL